MVLWTLPSLLHDFGGFLGYQFINKFHFEHILEPPGQFLATPWALGVDFETCGKDLELISKPSGGHLGYFKAIW